MKCNNSLLSLYRLNFPIKEEDSLFLCTIFANSVKELCVRLSAKKLALGAVIDIFGELYESQLVAIMGRKYYLNETQDSPTTTPTGCGKR